MGGITRRGAGWRVGGPGIHCQSVCYFVTNQLHGGPTSSAFIRLATVGAEIIQQWEKKQKKVATEINQQCDKKQKCALAHEKDMLKTKKVTESRSEEGILR